MIKKTLTELGSEPATGTTDEKGMVEHSVSQVQNLLSLCPNPTQNELRKLLAIQGHLLNTIGLEILHEYHGQRKNDKKISIALKALAASREALKAASNINDPTETLNIESSQDVDGV